MTDHPGNLLVLRDGSVLARAGGEGEARLTLDLVARYPHGLEAKDGDRLNAGPDELAAAAKFQADPDYANRVYGEVKKDGGLTWLQYWLWLHYNPKHLLGLGKHEGDWELVQVGLGSDDRPRKVTLSQHERGEGRDWEHVEQHNSADGVHPVVYVAPFSHANYFESGAHPYPVGIDNPDGSLDPVLPTVERLGVWKGWPGRWGNSEGVLASLSRGKLGGRSPRSPGHQGTRWTRPAKYHEEAEGEDPWRRLGRIARQLGRPTYPRLRSVTAQFDGQVLHVGYVLNSSPLRPASQLYVTVHRAEQPDSILLSRALTIKGRRGTVELLLPRPLEQCLVRASAFNAARQRSDPLPAYATAAVGR